MEPDAGNGEEKSEEIDGLMENVAAVAVTKIEDDQSEADEKKQQQEQSWEQKPGEMKRGIAEMMMTKLKEQKKTT